MYTIDSRAPLNNRTYTIESLIFISLYSNAILYIIDFKKTVLGQEKPFSAPH